MQCSSKRLRCADTLELLAEPFGFQVGLASDMYQARLYLLAKAAFDELCKQIKQQKGGSTRSIRQYQAYALLCEAYHDWDSKQDRCICALLIDCVP